MVPNWQEMRNRNYDWLRMRVAFYGKYFHACCFDHAEVLQTITVSVSLFADVDLQSYFFVRTSNGGFEPANIITKHELEEKGLYLGLRRLTGDLCPSSCCGPTLSQP